VTFVARSLRERDFRLYLAGQSVSFLGTWVQQVALSWIAYRMTGSPLVLAGITFAGQIPSLLLSPLGGVLADRTSRRKILVATQLIEMTTAAILAGAAGAGVLSPAILFCASLVVGVAVAFEMPARHAFLSEIVRDKSNVSNAIALNSVSFSAARLLGPAVGGLVLADFGDAVSFGTNALSYLPEIYTLLAVRTMKSDRARAASNVAGGVEYLRSCAVVRWLLITLACSSVALSPFAVLLPMYARNILGGDAVVLGTLMGAAGYGALVSGLLIARRKSVLGIESNVVAACLIAGIAAWSISWNTHYLVALALMMVSGGCTVQIVTSTHTLIQSLVPNQVRGQIMAFYTMCYGGAVSVGSLAMGAMAESLGIQLMFVVASSVYFSTGLALLWMLDALRREIYPILVEPE